MKDIASSCMIVATPTATVVFAATITVPGGNKEDTGLPFFLHNVSFKIFAVSNVISLVASSDSIVNFLSIVMQMKISYIVFVDGNLWTAILAIVVSFMPVILFVKQHLLFIKDVLRSTYATDYLIQEEPEYVWWSDPLSVISPAFCD
ncbi:hypothetical protein WN944_024606 [Citrus x changshan-huyou]|uniref:PGG domain-containing protein n=1 Tax=Citrus x changshan-huyou TaxID=2935761 RepID=A0AAP0LP83_9ROSI